MNIDLTDREMQLLIDCIGTSIETIRRRHDPPDSMVSELLTELADLDMDMREALHRKDDEWGDPDDADLLMDPVDFAAKHDTDPISIAVCDAEINAETQMFNAGVEAREQMKATSRAAGRRALNLRGNRTDDDRSEAQSIDVWDPNDPKNW